jgi:hypothetical protein
MHRNRLTADNKRTLRRGRRPNVQRKRLNDSRLFCSSFFGADGPRRARVADGGGDLFVAAFAQGYGGLGGRGGLRDKATGAPRGSGSRR